MQLMAPPVAGETDSRDRPTQLGYRAYKWCVPPLAQGPQGFPQLPLGCWDFIFCIIRAAFRGESSGSRSVSSFPDCIPTPNRRLRGGDLVCSATGSSFSRAPILAFRTSSHPWSSHSFSASLSTTSIAAHKAKKKHPAAWVLGCKAFSTVSGVPLTSSHYCGGA